MIKDKKRHITDCLIIVSALTIAGIITEDFIYLYIASIVGISSALIPFIAYGISFLWQSIGKILGFITSRIILSIIFYLILFPFSLLHKLFANNKSISNKKSETYWIKKDNTVTDFSKPW
ncbi:MAG: hypothetical protein PHW82_05670 [Bacteroidales bacterium]|nr:hypothetical protein [Bacteroidales bacterium]